MSDYRRGFGLQTGFIDHFDTLLVNTLNYNAIANLQALQITTAQAKSFQSAVVSTGCSLVTASNSEDSSTAPTKFFFTDSLTILSVLQLTGSQAGGHFTPTS
jgi:hypothetical protein